MKVNENNIRTTIFLSEHLRKTINELQKQKGCSMVEIIRKSVNLYNKLTINEDKIYIKTDNDEMERVIIL